MYCCLPAAARDGDFDTALAGSGRLRVALPSGSPVAEFGLIFGPKVVVQRDGAVVVGASDQGPNPAFHALRLRADGSLDSAYGTGGEAKIDFDLIASGQDQLYNLLQLADGNILLTGSSAGDGNSTGTDCALAELDQQGQLDSAFGQNGKLTFGFNAGPAGKQDDACFAVAVQHDGRLLAAGGATYDADNDLTMAVARLYPDGTPDNTFSSNGLSNKRVINLSSSSIQISYVQKVFELSTHKILLLGPASLPSASAASGVQVVWALVRLNADGSLDTSYASDGIRTYAFQTDADSDAPLDAVLLVDDSLVIAGTTAIQGVNEFQIAIAKFDADGNLDPSWGSNGRQVFGFGLSGAFDVAYGIAVDAMGRFVIAGSGDAGGGNFDMLAARLRADGQFDPAFGSGGKRDIHLSVPPLPDYRETGRSVAIAPDGRILIAGSAATDASGDNLVLGVAELIGDTVFADGFD